MNILEIFTNSILLIITLDSELWDIILLSLFVSFTALIIASLLGFIVGYYFAIYNFYFKKIILIIIILAYLLRFYRFKLGSELPQLPSK